MLLGGIPQYLRPPLAIADILFGLDFIARHHPHVAPAFCYRRFPHRIIAVRVAQPDLPSLLANFEMPAVSDPRRLVGQKVRGRGKSGEGRGKLAQAALSPLPSSLFHLLHSSLSSRSIFSSVSGVRP